MPCAYCGANLTIPEAMRTDKPKAGAGKKPPSARPAPSLENEAADILRKVQPIAVKAWNAYAYWTWIRRLLPACAIIVVVGLIVCAALGALPFVWAWLK